jgi:GNAT superfamily N-acetyltransferase
VTDYVTFAYLTDVFVLKSHQRRGLARWMMQGIREMLTPWPYLRGLVLMAADESAARMYRQELRAEDINDGPSAGLVILEMPGKGSVSKPNGH